jgi:hypothetical protein
LSHIAVSAASVRSSSTALEGLVHDVINTTAAKAGIKQKDSVRFMANGENVNN